MNRYWTPQEVAKRFGYSTNHVYILIRQGKITAMRAGKRGKIRITNESLIEAFGESADGLLGKGGPL